jgi:hypothetical protein
MPMGKSGPTAAFKIQEQEYNDRKMAAIRIHPAIRAQVKCPYEVRSTRDAATNALNEAYFVFMVNVPECQATDEVMFRLWSKFEEPMSAQEARTTIIELNKCFACIDSEHPVWRWYRKAMRRLVKATQNF